MDDYLDTQMDADDVFPCKGCGEILEEGKAFELGMFSNFISRPLRCRFRRRNKTAVMMGDTVR